MATIKSTTGNLNKRYYSYGDGTETEIVAIAGDYKPGADYDFIDVQQTSATVETYIYKLGGPGGTTVRTAVITYVDSTKNDIDTVAYS